MLGVGCLWRVVYLWFSGWWRFFVFVLFLIELFFVSVSPPFCHWILNEHNGGFPV